MNINTYSKQCLLHEFSRGAIEEIDLHISSLKDDNALWDFLRISRLHYDEKTNIYNDYILLYAIEKAYHVYGKNDVFIKGLPEHISKILKSKKILSLSSIDNIKYILKCCKFFVLSIYYFIIKNHSYIVKDNSVLTSVSTKKQLDIKYYFDKLVVFYNPFDYRLFENFNSKDSNYSIFSFLSPRDFITFIKLSFRLRTYQGSLFKNKSYLSSPLSFQFFVYEMTKSSFPIHSIISYLFCQNVTPIATLILNYEDKPEERIIFKHIKAREKFAHLFPLHGTNHIYTNKLNSFSFISSYLITGPLVQNILNLNNCSVVGSSKVCPPQSGLFNRNKILVPINSMEEITYLNEFLDNSFFQEYSILFRLHPAVFTETPNSYSNLINIPNKFTISNSSLENDLLYSKFCFFFTSSIGVQASHSGIVTIHLNINPYFSTKPLGLEMVNIKSFDTFDKLREYLVNCKNEEFYNKESLLIRDSISFLFQAAK